MLLGDVERGRGAIEHVSSVSALPAPSSRRRRHADSHGDGDVPPRGTQRNSRPSCGAVGPAATTAPGPRSGRTARNCSPLEAEQQGFLAQRTEHHSTKAMPARDLPWSAAEVVRHAADCRCPSINIDRGWLARRARAIRAGELAKHGGYSAVSVSRCARRSVHGPRRVSLVQESKGDRPRTPSPLTPVTSQQGKPTGARNESAHSNRSGAPRRARSSRSPRRGSSDHPGRLQLPPGSSPRARAGKPPASSNPARCRRR